MDSSLYIVALGAVVAGFVQGLSGFGFSMVAMSFWAWAIDPRLAAILAVFGAMSGQILSALSVRRGFQWSRLAPFLVGGAVGIPLGVAVLPLMDPAVFKAVIGAILVVACPLMLMARQLPRVESGGRLADALAGGAGGVMGGLGGFTGVIPTLWCTLRGLEKDQQRAIIQNFNLAALVATMLAYVAAGAVTRDMLPLFAIVAPALVIPSLIGSRVYLGISEALFRKVVLGLLTASGIAMLAASVPVLLAR